MTTAILTLHDHTLATFNGLLGEEEAKGRRNQPTESDMGEVEFPKRPPTSRDLSRRPIPDDYRPTELRMRAFDDDDDEGEQPKTDPPGPQNYSGGAADVGHVNMRILEEQLSRKPLDEIAALVRALTYGEMIELAEALCKTQPEGGDFNPIDLPALLHRWSTAQAS
jgi:hypothetical protein